VLQCQNGLVSCSAVAREQKVAGEAPPDPGAKTSLKNGRYSQYCCSVQKITAFVPAFVRAKTAGSKTFQPVWDSPLQKFMMTNAPDFEQTRILLLPHGRVPPIDSEGASFCSTARRMH
jgi:hypothetical protein